MDEPSGSVVYKSVITQHDALRIWLAQRAMDAHGVLLELQRQILFWLLFVDVINAPYITISYNNVSGNIAATAQELLTNHRQHSHAIEIYDDVHQQEVRSRRGVQHQNIAIKRGHLIDGLQRYHAESAHWLICIQRLEELEHALYAFKIPIPDRDVIRTLPDALRTCLLHQMAHAGLLPPTFLYNARHRDLTMTADEVLAICQEIPQSVYETPHIINVFMRMMNSSVWLYLAFPGGIEYRLRARGVDGWVFIGVWTTLDRQGIEDDPPAYLRFEVDGRVLYDGPDIEGIERELDAAGAMSLPVCFKCNGCSARPPIRQWALNKRNKCINEYYAYCVDCVEAGKHDAEPRINFFARLQ